MSSPQENEGGKKAVPDPDNNFGRGASASREERIRQRAHELWEQEGRPEGRAQDHWERAAQDLDREDAAIQREGVAGEKPGVKPPAEPKQDKRKDDRT
jgi:hypothetical protein